MARPTEVLGQRPQIGRPSIRQDDPAQCIYLLNMNENILNIVINVVLVSYFPSYSLFAHILMEIFNLFFDLVGSDPVLQTQNVVTLAVSCGPVHFLLETRFRGQLVLHL